MKISAIDIRKHTFEKIFRGYDPDEVDAFLNSLSQEWERFSSENSLLKMQLEYAEKELGKLKDIESTLFRTLKAAEDTSKLIEKEAIEDAGKRIEESKVRAEDMIREAEDRTNQIIRETDHKLKQFKEEFASEIKLQERDFRAIENFRDNLVVQLTSLANNTIETVERFENKYSKDSVLNRMEEIKQHVTDIDIPRKLSIPFVAPEEVPEAVVTLSDEKPEIAFEIVESKEEEERFEEPELEIADEVEEVAAVIPEPPVQVIEPVAIIEKEPVKSAADAVNEALAELQKSQKARDAVAESNRNKVSENSQPKKTGGSFFDQI